MSAGRHIPKLRGFTLIELLVVVSIIALLISILLPSLKRARYQAKVTKCAAQLHDIGASLMSYNNDYGRYPHQNTLGSSPQRALREAGAFWSYAVHKELARHMGGLRMHGNADADGVMNQEDRTLTHEVFYCPFAPPHMMEYTDVLSGPGTGNPVENTEDVYLHIGYAYFGGLHEAGNDPADVDVVGSANSNKLSQYVLEKRGKYVKKEPDSTRTLMGDMVMAWQRGTLGGGKWRINHGEGWQNRIPSNATYKAPRLDSANMMYGDAHVETKQPAHFKGLMNPDLNRLDVMKNAMLRFGAGVPVPASPHGDCLWW